MEVTSAQLYLQQLLRGLADPMGMMLAAGMVALCAMVIVTNNARWFALMLALFAVTCAPPISKWIVHVSFFFPVEFLRNWSRPVTFGLLLVLATGIARYDRGARHKLLPASFWWFVGFQLFSSLRLLTNYQHFQRGLFSIGVIVILLLVFVFSLAPALQSLADVNKALWAAAGVAIMATTATLIQWRISPGSVQHGGRLFGITATPQGIGMLLAMTLPTMCYLLIRRRQGRSVLLSLVTFGIFIPLVVMLVIWTGARGTALAALVGLLAFFHRRIGRFAVAGAVCVLVGMVLAPYLTDAFQISDRLFSLENTRAHPWTQMIEAIGRNPWFGQIPESANFYADYTVGEGAFLMSLSVFGIVGTIPLAVSFVLMFKELLTIYRHRSRVPELSDLVDLLLGFWFTIVVIGIFESFMLSYLTVTPLLMYTMFVLQGYAVDHYRQAMVPGFAVVPVEYPEYSEGYAPVA